MLKINLKIYMGWIALLKLERGYISEVIISSYNF